MSHRKTERFNPFSANVALLYPLKTSENRRFLRGVKVEHRLKIGWNKNKEREKQHQKQGTARLNVSWAVQFATFSSLPYSSLLSVRYRTIRYFAKIFWFLITMRLGKKLAPLPARKFWVGWAEATLNWLSKAKRFFSKSVAMRWGSVKFPNEL